MTVRLVELFDSLHMIEHSELLDDTLIGINSAYETFIARLSSKFQNSRTQSIFVITNYYHLVLALESENYAVLSGILEECLTRLNECLSLFAAEELLPYFTDILHVVEQRELDHNEDDRHETAGDFLGILQEFMSTYQNKCIVIKSAIQDAFPEECRARIFKFIAHFLLEKFSKFAEMVGRTVLVEQVRIGLERFRTQRNET